MATNYDIEITLRSKAQLKVLVEKMAENKTLKFLFSGVDQFRKESDTKVPLYEWLNNYKENPKHASVSLAYYDTGFVVCILVDDKYRQRVNNFLNGIKIPEKTKDSSTVNQETKDEKVNLYINSLDPEKAENIKKILAEYGVLNLKERPYYEQDPKY